MNKMLEKRIARLEKLLTIDSKFESNDSDKAQYIEFYDLMGVLVKLAGIGSANFLLKTYKGILENILTKYNEQPVPLDLPITASNFAGDLAGLLENIFKQVRAVMLTAEESNTYNDSIRKKYSI